MTNDEKRTLWDVALAAAILGNVVVALQTRKSKTVEKVAVLAGAATIAGYATLRPSAD